MVIIKRFCDEKKTNLYLNGYKQNSKANMSLNASNLVNIAKVCKVPNYLCLIGSQAILE